MTKSSRISGLIMVFLITLFIPSCTVLQAQKNIHILDAFYEAITNESDSKTFIDLKGGHFTTDMTPGNLVQVVSPKTIIARYPEAKKYLTKDSTFIIKNELLVKGNVLGDYGDPSLHLRNFEMEGGFYFRINVMKVGVEAGGEIFYGSNFHFDNLKVKGRSAFDSGGNFIMTIRNCEWEQLDLAFINPPKVILSDNKIDLFQVFGVECDNFELYRNVIERGYIRSLKSDLVHIEANTFDVMEKDDLTSRKDSFTYFRPQILGYQHFSIIPGKNEINNFELIDNHFKTSEQSPSILIESAGNRSVIIGNKFDANIRLASRARSSFEMYNNEFSTISLMASLPSTPQNYVDIKWKDLEGKLVWKRDEHTPTYYGLNELELADVGNYNNLTSSYRKLVEVYKNNGNSKDANNAYLAMKHLERERYKYVLRTEGGSDNLFRLKLHQLLAVYTRHGTDPAQAITASIRLIFLFSIIYFFFPSDWDEKSKSQLLQDFNLFRKKNEHGYVKPFLKLLKGSVLSLFNAFILSVNSFVTLGFGRIPTKGFAKYICILEGFLGWFLLSIFIVSLINQVLF